MASERGCCRFGAVLVSVRVERASNYVYPPKPVCISPLTRDPCPGAWKLRKFSVDGSFDAEPFDWVLGQRMKTSVMLTNFSATNFPPSL